jgi:hypothetical protein
MVSVHYLLRTSQLLTTLFSVERRDVLLYPLGRSWDARLGHQLDYLAPQRD